MVVGVAFSQSNRRIGSTAVSVEGGGVTVSTKLLPPDTTVVVIRAAKLEVREDDAELDIELDNELDVEALAEAVPLLDKLWLENCLAEIEAELWLNELLFVERLLIEAAEEVAPATLVDETDGDEPLFKLDDTPLLLAEEIDEGTLKEDEPLLVCDKELLFDGFWMRDEVLNVVGLELDCELLVEAEDFGAKAPGNNIVDLSSMIADPSKDTISVPIVYALPWAMVRGADEASENTKPVASALFNTTVA